MKRFFFGAAMMIISMTAAAQESAETGIRYLSGTGCDDMVEWDFYCTGGRNAGKWTKIGVPSCWELQGFGTYQYGMRFYGKATPEGIADEKGQYKHEFFLPEEWQGRQIMLVFEGSMTDTRVTINGRKAGSGLHQGGFYRFSFDVSDRVFFGKKKNVLEVTVSKESDNKQVNMAERRADYWNFGGLFRPVFVVAKPAQNIARVAVDAKGDGRFIADCYLNRAVEGASVEVQILDNKGKCVARSKSDVRSSDIARFDFNAGKVKTWTAETPDRYTALFSLIDVKGKVLHRERQKFGFRTIEYRESDGVYINGEKVIFKGVNRHSFRPETGRTLSKAKNIEDVELIKSMNMNAVRLSHYPADPDFLDACDSLGLYVECELSGWHWAHETVTGSKLVEEMVTRDVNHPSIIFWSNGNEGGFNYELEEYFYKFDPQKRVVLYPWANRNGFETKHYRSYGETQEYMRQKEIFMPTEFLHGLYDGGHGAGLADYWEMMMQNPRCAGGFLWDLMDQAVVRTDMDNVLDCQGNFGADGIVGPHAEKEGSFYTIKEVWSPVVISADDSQENSVALKVENRYDFLNLNTCSFAFRYLKMPEMGDSKISVVKEGKISAPDLAPHHSAALSVPETKADYDALEITVKDKNGSSIYNKVFRHDEIAPKHEISASKKISEDKDISNLTILTADENDEISIDEYKKQYTFSASTGLLQRVNVGGKTISFGNGPRFVAARRSDRSFDQFYNHDDKEAEKKKTQYTMYADQGSLSSVSKGKDRDGNDVVVVKYKHGSLQKAVWTFLSDGTAALDYHCSFGGVVDLMGIAFDYPEEKVKSKAWVGKGPYRVWQNRMQGPQWGYYQNDYNDPIPGESWTYPEFKGYFESDWMMLVTDEGKIGIELGEGDSRFVGVYQPRDGRDHILYDLPATGISILKVIPAVRNKVNTTDLNGPSAQPYWSDGKYCGRVIFSFE